MVELQEVNILSVREYIKAIGNPELVAKAALAYSIKEVAGKHAFERISSIEVSCEEGTSTCVVTFSSKRAHTVACSRKDRIVNLAVQISGREMKVQMTVER